MINTHELKAALDKLNLVIPSRTTFPTLKYVKLQTKNNGKLAITGTNLTITLTINIDYIGDELNLLIPARELKDIVDTVRYETINLKPKENKVVLYDGRHRTTFKCMDIDNFPEITENLTEQFKLDGGIIQSYFRHCAISCDKKEERGVLLGINLIGQNEMLIAQSADGFRASLIKMMLGVTDFDVTFAPITPRILQLFNGAISVHVTEKNISFFNQEFTYTSQLLTGNFPDVKSIIPATHIASIIVDKTKLSNAVKRSLVFAKNTSNIIKFNLEPDILKISSEDDTGQNSLEIEIEYDGIPISFGLNGMFVKEFLTTADQNVVIEIIDGQNPLLFKIPSRPEYIHVIMPMHLKNR